MASNKLRDDLDFAVEVAWRAGRLAHAHYQTGTRAQVKPDATPVTEADRESELTARELISTRYPDDGILGEEFGAEREGAARRWILDPIDGTRTFIRGVPFWGVMVALEVDGVPRLGVLHFPALDETVYAATGEGCWWNGRRARVSDRAELCEALVLTTDHEAARRGEMSQGWQRLCEGAALARTWGDCYGYALVATGRAEAMLDPEMSHWDMAALGPIIGEAGGVLTNAFGEAQYPATSALATNAALAETIHAKLGGGT